MSTENVILESPRFEGDQEIAITGSNPIDAARKFQNPLLTGAFGSRFFCLSFCFAFSLAFGQTLEITPALVLIDEVPVIRATGLDANEHVVLEARLVDGADEAWASHASFVAGADGIVDASKQAPQSGSYKPVSAAGLIWSMMPESKNVRSYRPPLNFADQVVTFRLLRNGAPVAVAELRQISKASDVTQTKLTGALHGILFKPEGAGPHPGLLVLGGSEGGLPTREAAWLASHGYAALALAYFRYEDLPQRLEAIPLEYFGRALAWMKEQPEISGERLGVVGTSRGGELALQLGSMYPDIRTVVALVPASFRHGACCGGGGRPFAWTWGNAPLAFVNRFNGREIGSRLDATIHVENTHGPILLIAGQDDGVWESSSMTAEVMSRLKQSHFPHVSERLDYPHAGHRAGHAGIAPAWQGAVRHPVSGLEIHPGGTPEGNALSSLAATPKVLDFLRRGLAARSN